MSSLDMGVHQIADALKRKGMYDDTIFIFTGDNGGTYAKLLSNNFYSSNILYDFYYLREVTGE